MLHHEIPAEVFAAIVNSNERIELNPIGMPDKVVRQHLVENISRRLGFAIRDIVELRDEHLDYIDSNTAISIPSFDSYLAPLKMSDQISPFLRYERGLYNNPDNFQALYTVASKIIGSSISPFENSDLSFEELKRIARDKNDSLHDYASWIKRTGQPLYLYDISADRQFTFGRLAEEGERASDRLFMHDLDPYMSKVKNDSESILLHTW